MSQVTPGVPPNACVTTLTCRSASRAHTRRQGHPVSPATTNDGREAGEEQNR